jgi:hypothetical protein
VRPRAGEVEDRAWASSTSCFVGGTNIRVGAHPFRIALQMVTRSGTPTVSGVPLAISCHQELAPIAVQGGLAYLDQVAIGVAHVAADLGLVLFRWREELTASRAPLAVHSLDVRDPDVEEAAGPVRIARCLERDAWLVVGGAATDVDDDPAIGEGDI